MIQYNISDLKELKKLAQKYNILRISIGKNPNPKRAIKVIKKYSLLIKKNSLPKKYYSKLIKINNTEKQAAI